MVLFVVGLGLGDEKDVTIRGLEAIRSCKKAYLEFYTSILGVDSMKLQEFYGIPVVPADRFKVESEAEDILEQAKGENIAFLVVGDPLCATTHMDLILRGKTLGIVVEVIQNSSVMGAVAISGLQVKEPDTEAMIQGKMILLPPRFMTVTVAVQQLLEVEETRKEGVLSEETLAVGMARLGQSSQKIVFGTLKQLLKVTSFGGPLHCLAVCGQTHPMELEALEYYRASEADFTELIADDAPTNIDEIIR